MKVDARRRHGRCRWKKGFGTSRWAALLSSYLSLAALRRGGMSPSWHKLDVGSSVANGGKATASGLPALDRPMAQSFLHRPLPRQSAREATGKYGLPWGLSKIQSV